MCTVIAPPDTHPDIDPDDLDFDDDESCSEGFDDEECDRICTRRAKAMGVCKCRRHKRDE